MNIQFRNRTEAGRLLAQKLSKYTRRSDVTVLALSSGGVMIGYEIAQYLDAPLHLLPDNAAVNHLNGRTVIVVHEGLVQAESLAEVLATLRHQNAARVAVAAPVIAKAAFNELSTKADEVFALIMPLDVHNISEWYIDFPNTSDLQARELLTEASQYYGESTALL